MTQNKRKKLDPFSLNGDFFVSDAGSVAMMLPEGNINNDQCLGLRLTSVESNYSGLSQYFPTKKYRSANADP